MSEKENWAYIACDSIGSTFEDVKLEEINSGNGQHYWKATQEIGTLFGMEVDGEIEAIGSTKEQCLENLAKERKKLNDSLWV